MIGALLGVFFVFGVPLGLLLAAMYRKARTWGKTAIFVVTRDGDWRESWVKNPTVLKINGKEARPALSAEYRHTYRGRPAYAIDAATGNPLRVTHDPERLREVAEREEAGWTWPDAYDNANAYSDGRAKAVATSTRDDRLNWAKVGAIAGGIAVFLLVVILGLLFNFVRQTGTL